MPSQLDTLAAHGVPRDRFFAEKVSTRVRVRPKFEAALEACRQIKAHAPHCRVILTVYEIKRLGRDSAELTTLADHLTAHGIALEMLAGPLTGIYDSTGTGRVLFAFFAAMAETERENIREAMLEGLNAAARKGHHGGRPPVITDDMLHTVLRRLASAESVELIRSDLTVPTGKRKGRNPSLAPASTGHWPSTRKRRRTSKPSNKPTPTRRAPGGHLIGPSNWITEGQRVARPYRPIFGGYYRDPKTAHRYCLELRRLGRRSLAHWPSTNATSSTPAPPRAHRWHTSCSLNSFRVRHGAACCGWSWGHATAARRPA
ncbi:MAG: recombinase family protein [Pseudonocardiaceae bacterium]